MGTPKKNQPQRRGTEAAKKNKLKLNGTAGVGAKSTATAAQYRRVLDLLRVRKRSTIELRRCGVIAPAARIKELKDRYGYDIPTVERVTEWDDEGFAHPLIAVYELQGEPEGQ